MHEAGDKGLGAFPAFTAALTTELAVPESIRYLATWRLLPASMNSDDPVWDHIQRAAAPGPPYFYVPAFSLARPVVQRLGVRLTEVQPALELTPGAPAGPGSRPALVEAGSEVAVIPGSPDFGAVSPVLIGRREAWGLAHFVYMAIGAREVRELHPIDCRLEPGGEDLLFLPAVWDPRYIHESNWRLLLREFDGLVA